MKKAVIFLSLIFLLCYNVNAVAKMKRVYKYMVTDHQGNKWLEYSVIDPMHYVRVNGGFAVIKEVRILDYRYIKVNSSLYCKNIEEIGSWKPKDYAIREVFGEKAVDKKPKPASVEKKIPRFSNASNPDEKEAKKQKGKKDNRPIVVLPSRQRRSLGTRTGRTKFRLDSYDKFISSLVKPKEEVVKQPERLAEDSSDRSRADEKKIEPQALKEQVKSSQLNERIMRRIKRYDPLIVKAAKKHNLDQNLFRSLVYVESSGNRLAISPKKAMGLTQLTHRTAKAMNVRNVFDPEQNLMGGAKYLSLQMKTFGNERDALAAYNAGPSRARRSNLPTETKNFIDKVLHVKEILDLPADKDMEAYYDRVSAIR